jgi:long-subunit fatty acid transport protein
VRAIAASWWPQEAPGMFRRTLIVTAIALVAASLPACGESSEETATAKLCDARAGIAEEVDQLKAITVTTATSSKISASLQSIRDDLSTIAEARGDLSEDRRAQVDKANDTFAATVTDLAGTLLKTTSLEQGRAELETALAGLATSYRDSLGRIDCP